MKRADSRPRCGQRSYVIRSGRTTPARRRALAEHWARYGIEARAAPLGLDACFGRRAPRVLEIGFGAGETLLRAASATPERDFLGIEVYEAGIGRVLAALAAGALDNVRVLRADAAALLAAGVLPPCAFVEVWIYFPDPWPKKRHRKRRLVQPDFAADLRRILEPGGCLRLATDWSDYAEHMLEVLEGCAGLANLAAPGAWAPRPGQRPPTRFERRGAAAGRQVRDLAFIRER